MAAETSDPVVQVVDCDKQDVRLILSEGRPGDPRGRECAGSSSSGRGQE
jgi:hypothetical protein